MESPRDARVFKQNGRTRSTVTPCSSLAMEVKRKKIVDGVLFVENEVCLWCFSPNGARGQEAILSFILTVSQSC